MFCDFAGLGLFAEGYFNILLIEEAFDPSNPDRYAKYPTLENLGNSSGHNTQVSDFWIRNASYLRIKNVQLGYTFPKEWLKNLGISNLRMYIASENPYTFHKFPYGWDPEISTSGQFYPILRNFTFGLNLKF